jgi:hypothetical protein
LCEGFDIAFNDVAVRPGVEDTDGAGTGVRVRQGVTDTAAEAALASGCGRVENTSELYAGAAGAAWVTIRNREELAAAGTKLQPDVVARVRQELDGGYFVIVAKEPVRVDGRELAAWWRVDPATGQTLGIGQLGWGQTMTDYAFLVARILLKGALFFKCMGSATGNVGGMLLCTFIFFAGGGALAAGGVAGNAIAILADFGSLMK